VLIAFLEIVTGGAGTRAINLPALLGHEGGLGRILNLIGESEFSHPVWSNLFGFAVFLVLSALLLRTGLKGESGAVAPPPAPGRR
jgi:hypothetical protein